MSRLWRAVASRGLWRSPIHNWGGSSRIRSRCVGSRVRRPLRFAAHWRCWLIGPVSCTAISSPVPVSLDRWRRTPLRIDAAARSIGVDRRGNGRRRGHFAWGVGAARSRRRVAADCVQGLVPIRIGLAVRLRGRTVLRTLSAATTRGTSTFVHAAVLCKGGLLRLLARIGPNCNLRKFAVMLCLNAARHRAKRISRNRSESGGFAVR
jgi:hypothetical protein